MGASGVSRLVSRGNTREDILWMRWELVESGVKRNLVSFQMCSAMHEVTLVAHAQCYMKFKLSLIRRTVTFAPILYPPVACNEVDLQTNRSHNFLWLPMWSTWSAGREPFHWFYTISMVKRRAVFSLSVTMVRSLWQSESWGWRRWPTSTVLDTTAVRLSRMESTSLVCTTA